jgi:5-aminolevulinate synthase
MQVNSLLRFGSVCPFIGGATPTTLRALAKTHGVSNMSSLTARALACPMMGPQLAAIGQARAYASVAANKDIADMHNVSMTRSFRLWSVDRSRVLVSAWLFNYPKAYSDEQGKDIRFDPSQKGDDCPHASAARGAAVINGTDGKRVKAAGTFDYGKFYESELDKKHKDK